MQQPSVFITGANRGIGLQLTKHYLKQNWLVYASYRNKDGSEELLQLAQDNQHLQVIQLDVVDYSKLATVSNWLPALDLLINNAGYYGPKGYGLGNVDVDEWRRVFEINTIAPLKLVEALLPNLEKGKLRKIACLSSKVGSITENTSGGGYLYRSSKAALNSVVKSLSNDLTAQGFAVLALHPGWVQTEMGGPNALISTQTSASGLYQVIESADVSQSGSFINYDGSHIPW